MKFVDGRLAAQVKRVLVVAMGFCALALGAPESSAHSVWLEPLDGKMVVRFGEPDGSYEKSPGHLDELAFPLAVRFVTNAPVAVDPVKKTNHFALPGAAAAEVICVEAPFEVMVTPGRPGRKPIFYARWQPAGAPAPEPALTLDLVPTGKAGEVRAYFRGKPLGGIKAILVTPDEHEAELTADADGFLRFDSKQSGQHHLSIGRHREEISGFHGGRAYGLTSHNAALTWRQP